MARLKAQAVTIQALLIAAVTLVVLGFVLTYAFQRLTQQPVPRYSKVEATLCGTMLTVYNDGPYTVKVMQVRVYDGSSWRDVPASLPVVLEPGQEWTYNLAEVYQKAVVSGDGFEAVVAVQECS